VTGAFGPSTSSSNTASTGGSNAWPPVPSSSSSSEPESSASDEGSSDASAGSSSGGGAHVYHTDTQTYGPDGFISSKDFLDNIDSYGCFVGSSGADAKPTNCSNPHDIEVYAHFGMGNDAYPPEAELRQGAESGCNDKASDLSAPYEVTSGALIPTKQAWDDGDHNALCFVVKAGSGQMTGSVAGN
jgi:Septum formation